MGVIMLKRKLQNMANLLLGAILLIIFLKFLYYLLKFNGLFMENPNYVNIIRLLQASPPLFIWFYSTSIITGTFIFSKRMLLHTLPIIFGFLFFMPQLINGIFSVAIPFSLETYDKWYGLIYAQIAGILFLIYSWYIFRQMRNFYGPKLSLKECLLDANHTQLTLLKLLSSMMNVYALILIIGGYLAFVSNGSSIVFDYMDIGFLIVLSFLMVFIIMSSPKVIHFNYSKLSKSVNYFRYEKSTLTRDEAEKYVHELDSWMTEDHPYLNNNLSLGDFVERLQIPGHVISEVLNGLLNKNFYEYINYYRVEEFKRLVKKPENSNDTNLGLAYQAGFNSKTAFNTSFKKFTDQTPSNYRTNLKNK